MAKMIEGFGAMALELVEVEAGMALFLSRGLGRVLSRIQKTAKAEFGVYQDAIGEFPGWPELAQATKDERVKQGFTENDPLERSGQLRDAVTKDQDGFEGVVGVKSGEEHQPYADGRGGGIDMGVLMAVHEFGDDTTPARPVLGPAAYRNKSAIERLVGAAAVAGLIGGEQIHAALGYDFETSD